jgi:hypothetical protein
MGRLWWFGDGEFHLKSATLTFYVVCHHLNLSHLPQNFPLGVSVFLNSGKGADASNAKCFGQARLYTCHLSPPPPSRLNGSLLLSTQASFFSHPQYSLTMLPAERLPPELWLIIFELARGTNIGPQQHCNYLTFPLINLHIRRPSEHRFMIHPWPRNFRLICRYFNTLLQPLSSFFMKDAETSIPTAARALYILPQQNPQACLQRLLADPSIPNRIVLLNLPGYEGSRSPPTYFDLLCDNANSLPALRTLTLALRNPHVATPPISRFWGRLDNAFPLLTTLVLRGGFQTTYPDAAVVFENLEILDWDFADLHASLYFPLLRHVSFGHLYYFELKYLASWPQLESLIIRDINGCGQIEWSLFPELRLLGLPARRIDAFPPLPPNHPLQHLYVFVGTRPRDDHNPHLFSYEVRLTWLKETLERLPTITRITLWFDKRRPNQLDWISGYFHEEDLELLGFTERDFPNPNREHGHHVVFQRVRIKPETIMGAELVLRRSGFRAGWNKFVQSASRRLHL